MADAKDKPTTQDFLKEAAKDEPKAKVFDMEGTPYWPKTPEEVLNAVPDGYEQAPDGAYRRVISS